MHHQQALARLLGHKCASYPFADRPSHPHLNLRLHSFLCATAVPATCGRGRGRGRLQAVPCGAADSSACHANKRRWVVARLGVIEGRQHAYACVHACVCMRACVYQASLQSTPIPITQTERHRCVSLGVVNNRNYALFDFWLLDHGKHALCDAESVLPVVVGHCNGEGRGERGEGSPIQLRTKQTHTHEHTHTHTHTDRHINTHTDKSPISTRQGRIADRSSSPAR